MELKLFLAPFIFNDEDFFIFPLHEVFAAGEFLELQRIIQFTHNGFIVGDLVEVVFLVLVKIPDFQVKFAMNYVGVAVQEQHPENKSNGDQQIFVAQNPEPSITSEVFDLHN